MTANSNDHYETALTINHSLSDDVYTMAVTPDGKFVILGGGDNSIV